MNNRLPITSTYSFGLILLLGNLVAAQGPSNAQLPNIIFINAEDMSPHLGCYGHPDGDTPHIDRIARQGLVFQNAFATAPICSPSRSCLATGLYATSMGTQHLRCEVQIPKTIVPLALRLKERGYFCTNAGKSDYNFTPDGIWDAWTNDPSPWIQRPEGQPFFAFITVGETHEGRINYPDRQQAALKNFPAERRHDPSTVSIPPFYPDTPEIRRIFAGMYDLASVFDNKVGQLVEALEQQGELDRTFIFIFGDHGNGIPRYKRWLGDSGLRVPLVVHVPAEFRDLSPFAPGARPEQQVSFVDFPATALSLAGVATPEPLEGKAFLGNHRVEAREYVFGARSRADDMFEMSRSVCDGRYIYVRHFMPHLPYMQQSVINDDRKDTARELRRLHLSNQLNEVQSKLWLPAKPREELYDLKVDPHELKNLAMDVSHAEIKEKLQTELRKWMLSTRDSGLLPEAEYQQLALEARSTPFEVLRDPRSFDVAATLEAAERVGDSSVGIEVLVNGLEHPAAGVRYWSALAIHCGLLTSQHFQANDQVVNALTSACADERPAVAVAAAEALSLAAKGDPRHLSSLSTRSQDSRRTKGHGLLSKPLDHWLYSANVPNRHLRK